MASYEGRAYIFYDTGALKPFAYRSYFKKVRPRKTIDSSQYRITAEHGGSLARVD
jgi:hypothetical protein